MRRESHGYPSGEHNKQKAIYTLVLAADGAAMGLSRPSVRTQTSDCSTGSLNPDWGHQLVCWPARGASVCTELLRVIVLADWSLTFPDSTSRPPPGNLTGSCSPPSLAPSISVDLPPVSYSPLRATSCQLPTQHNNELLEKTGLFLCLSSQNLGQHLVRVEIPVCVW